MTKRDRQTTTTRVDLRRLVTQQRKLSYPSVRKAAEAGGISNTTWGSYESGKEPELKAAMRRGVARAFGWPEDWPENPPGVEAPEPTDLAARVAELEAQLARLTPQVAENSAELARGWDALSSLVEQVQHLDHVVRQLVDPAPPDSESLPDLEP